MKKIYIFLFGEAQEFESEFSRCETYLSNCVKLCCYRGLNGKSINIYTDRVCFIQAQTSDDGSTVDVRHIRSEYFKKSQTRSHKENIRWLDLSSWNGNISGNITYSESLVDTVNSIVRNLPKFGVQLEVVWVRSSPWPDVGSHLDLFGELKCLSCWYNARLLLVASHSVEEDKHLLVWANVLSAEKVSIEVLNESAETNIPVWNGLVKMYASESEDAVLLPGFSLHPHCLQLPNLLWKVKDTEPEENMEDIFYQNHMEFLAFVNIREIPVFYITSLVYEICVKCEGMRAKKSKKFLNQLLENECIGYIVRLSSSTSWKAKKKEKNIFKNSNTTIEDKSWVDAVIENSNCPYDPSEDIELDGEQRYLHFLLCKSRGRSDRDKVLAYRLRHPREINSAASEQLAKLESYVTHELEESLLGGEPDDGDISAFLKQHDLPYYDTQSWLEMEDRVREAQCQVLQQWADHNKEKGEETLLDIRQLYFMFEETRRVYIEKYKAKYGDYNTEIPSVELLHLNPPKPEYENVHTQLERMVLVYNNSLESKMARFKSSDSLAGLSPPGQVVKLNAEEFLKHFTKDGEPKKEQLSTLKVKKTRMNKFDSGELKKSEWPDCSHFKYHDIYYNVGLTPEKLEKKSVRLKTKLHHIETSSTCNAQQTHGPQTLALKDEVKQTRTRQSLKRSSITPPNPKRKLVQSQRTPRSSRKRTLSSEDTRQALHNTKKRKLETPPKVSPTSTNARVKNKPAASSHAGKPDTSLKQQKNKSPASSQAGKINTSQEQQKNESRSQRHKRKLEAAVTRALEVNGVTKSQDRAMYKACFHRLYLLSYSFIKDLRDYSSLTEEMENITTMQAPTVVRFEKNQQNKK